MHCLAFVALVALPASDAFLRRPTDAAQKFAASGASAEANPEIDAWHDAEKRRIEQDCDEMMRKLMEEKRRKLQAIVDQRQRELDEALRLLAQAQREADGQMAKLRKEEHEAEAEATKVPPAKAAIGDAEAVAAKWREEVRRLRELIAEKQACIEELRDAQNELADAKRKLADARRRLAERQAQRDAQKDKFQKETGHVNNEEADVDDAEDDLARAKARLAAALRRLAKAEADLKEHDEATPNTYSR